MRARRVVAIVVAVGLTATGLVVSTVFDVVSLLILSIVAALALSLLPVALALWPRGHEHTVATADPVRHGTPDKKPGRDEPRPTVAPRLIVPPKLRADPTTLSDEELCWVWRASFGAVRRAEGVAELEHWARVRAGYLDEMQRRHAEGFVCWLADGARAGSDPRRYLCDAPRTHRRSVVPDFPE